MTEPATARAVELLIEQAWDAHAEDRYPAALAAASRAVQAAEQLDDPALLVRALVAEATALQMSGDHVGGLARYTRVLGLAQDPTTRAHLDHPTVTWEVACAYLDWVVCARFVSGIGKRELFGVLDAAENWFTVTGHRDWRAGILLQRASVHERLGELDAAITAAQEALALYHPDVPGYTLATYRWRLGDLLRRADRAGEAELLYQGVLDDPDASLYERKVALEGLAWCALDAQDSDTARRHATAAVQLADTLGDAPLSTALAVLVEACRAGGDHDGAWAAATRHLEIGHRLGGHYALYYAIRDALDVALDRHNQDSATELLSELDTHASALDTDTGQTTLTDEVAQRRHRLTQIDTTP